MVLLKFIDLYHSKDVDRNQILFTFQLQDYYIKFIMKRDNQDQIKQLLKFTISLINDCTLDNGAIVAANSTKTYYSSEAKNYFYVFTAV